MNKLIQKQYLDKSHGDKIKCPTCGMPGFLDTETPEKQIVKDGAIWFNPYPRCGWECTDCYDK